MYMCVYACSVDVWTFVCACTCSCTCVLYVCVFLCVYNMHVCMCLCVSMHVCVCLYVVNYSNKCVWSYAHHLMSSGDVGTGERWVVHKGVVYGSNSANWSNDYRWAATATVTLSTSFHNDCSISQLEPNDTINTCSVCMYRTSLPGSPSTILLAWVSIAVLIPLQACTQNKHAYVHRKASDMHSTCMSHVV